MQNFIEDSKPRYYKKVLDILNLALVLLSFLENSLKGV